MPPAAAYELQRRLGYIFGIFYTIFGGCAVPARAG